MTRILHLSDTHVTASGIDMDGVDAVAALDGILHDARHVPDLDAVVVSGDIADDGSAAGCGAVVERVGAFAAERGIPHIYSTGNHDARGPFREVLGTGHRDADGSDRGRLLDPESDLCTSVSLLGELRIITLDSLVPGKTHGFLDEHQLACLAAELATPTRDGTVLVLHHPPLHLTSLPWVADVVLRNISALGRVVRSSDVRTILAGHLHFQVSGFLAGVPVWVTPGVVTRIDTTAPPHLVRGVLGAGASIVDLADPASPTFHVISARDPRAGEQVYLYDPASGDDVAEEL